MKLRKILAGAIASALTAAALSVAASATLYVPDSGIAYGTSIGTVMWRVRLFSVADPEYNVPAVDYGIDVESITRIEFKVTPHDYDEAKFDSSLDGGYGGGIVMSCSGGVLGDDFSRNWNSLQFWGIGEQTATDLPGILEEEGNGVWSIAWDVPEEYRFVTGADCCQIAFQEWGNSFVDLEILELNCYDASGNVVIAFDGLGNATIPTPSLPSKPTNVKAATGDKQVTLSWTAAEGAASYSIYKYENSKYGKIDSTTGTSYTVKGLTNGTTYKFLVRAFNSAGGSEFATSDLVSATPKAPVPSKPTNVKATAGDKQVTLSWTASTGAASYTIYKYDSGKYGKVTSTTDTSFTIKGLTNGTTYKFLVRAFNTAGGSAFTTADLVSATPKATVTAVPVEPTVSADVQDKVVTFSWNAVEDADYYKLYNYSNGKYGLIATTTDTSYRLRYLKNGTTYQVLVRAFNEKGGSKFTTADLITVIPKAATAVPSKANVVATVSNGNVNLTWTHIPTAFSYTVYKYENGTYTKLGATCDNSITIKGLTAGKSYKLLVRAFNGAGGNKFTHTDLVAITV